MKKHGLEGDIVLGTRVRLARNFAKIPFPAIADRDQSKSILNKCNQLTPKLSEIINVKFHKLAEVDQLERQVMMERHLISPQQTENVIFKGLILSENEDVSIMVNEEDHLRIQVLLPGLALMEAWQLASRIDDTIEENNEYAFDQNLGYLTSCPTNVGTGMRASVMLHLPALARINQLSKVLGSVSQFGLVIRGIYGEGSESYGNMYQISNQVSLGHTEEDIIDHLTKMADQIIKNERQARQFLMQDEYRLKTEDKIYRSFGVLSNARIMDTKESLELLSEVKLGIDLGLFEDLDDDLLKELIVEIRSAHLQKTMGQSLPEKERDRLRASLIRDRIQKLQCDKQREGKGE